MASDSNEHDNLWRWLSHSEDSIFLLDGLNNLKDLLVPTAEELPPSESADFSYSSQKEDITQLENIIKGGIHKTNHRAHVSLFNYRMQALNGIWKARKTAKYITDELIAERKKKAAATKSPKGFGKIASDTSELTLLMLFPLIESQTKIDPGLKSSITNLLLDYFIKAQPMSIKGPNSQLDGIENLLMHWIEQDKQSLPTIQALIALACSRDSIDTLIRTAFAIMSLDLDILEMSELLTRVLKFDYEDNEPKILDVHYHLRGFHYNAKKISNSRNNQCECKELVRRSIIPTKEKYLIVSNATGCHLTKIGTGYEETIAGLVYTQSTSCLMPSLFAEVNGVTIQRPCDFDKNADRFGFILTDELEKGIEIGVPEEMQIQSKLVKTILIQGQNNYLIWLRLVSTADMTDFVPQLGQFLVVSDLCSFNPKGNMCLKNRRILLKNSETGETIAKILKCLKMPHMGRDTSNCSFDSQSSTSCGVSASSLLESQIMIDEQFITIVTPNPETRTGSKLVRTLGTTYSFDLGTGILHSQHDLLLETTLAPPSLPRGFSIASSSIAYCPKYHRFWALAYNRIDEFLGTPGYESGSYLKQKLSVHSQLLPESSRMLTISQLLEHAAIQMMKANEPTQLKTVQSLLKIVISLQNSIPQLSILAVQILTKANIGEEDRDYVKKHLDLMLQNIDKNYVEMVLCLRFKLCPQSICDQIEELLNENIPDVVTHSLKILYIKSMIHQFPEEVVIEDKSWAMFCKFFDEEVKICSAALRVRKKQLDFLIYVISSIGTRAFQDPNRFKELFKQVFTMACSGSMSWTEKLASLKILDLDKIEAVVETSLIGPTYLGCLLSFAKQVQLQGNDFLTLLTELFSKIARLMSDLNIPQLLDYKLENLLPWVFKRTFSSSHPISEGYRLQETIKLPGAKCLLLLFDEHCSTTTENDKLSLYSGPSMSGKKILEYSGNINSSRRIGQKSWPRKPILFYGDCITIDFEVKSKQDSEMSWGCHISIAHCPADLFETFPLNSFVNALLMLTPLLSYEITKAYRGKPISLLELQCSHLLSSKILQRCNWSKSKLEQMIHVMNKTDHDDILPPISLIPSKTISTLRSLAGFGLPLMRESTKKLLQPHLLEEAIVSVVIKHMGLEATLESFLQDQDSSTPDGCLLSDIMLDVYMKISVLIRKLQSIVEMETKWNSEVQSFKNGLITLKEVFFNDYLHHEERAKELSLLFFLKKIKEVKPQKAMQQLKSILQQEASSPTLNDVTQSTVLVKGLFCRLDLLLRADINSHSEKSSMPNKMSMSLQNWPSNHSNQMKRQQSHEVDRFWDDSILKIAKLQRSVSKLRQSRSIIESFDTVPLDLESNPESIVSELFAFIGSSPEDSVPAAVFLEAILERLIRCEGRQNALKTMNALMKAVRNIPQCLKYISCTFSEIFSIGLRFNELKCSKSVTKLVLSSFSECLYAFVATVIQNPEEYFTTLSYICITPYNKEEEELIVQSGLLALLNTLCDGVERMSTSLSSLKTMSQLAWYGFKILAKRCVEWENVNQRSTGMEKQISKVLSDHLAQAAECGHKSVGQDAVCESIKLLKDLSSTKMGKGILAQPACTTNLLHILMDQNVSPHTIYTVIVLLQESLPFMAQCNLPDISSTNNSTQERSIVDCLLIRLSKLITPSLENECGPTEFPTSLSFDVQECLNYLDDGTQQALLVHKRVDQSGHELIQQLLNASSDIGLFSAIGSDSMEKIIRIDKDINQKNIAEVMIGDATKVLRAATKMAQLGFVVSISSPNEFHESSNEWRHRATQICSQRNTAVAQNHPMRPFISSNVANKLSTEIIILLQRLVHSENSENWMVALQAATDESFGQIPTFLHNLHKLSNDNFFDQNMFESGQRIAAALAVFGGFYETIKVGSNVVLKSLSEESNVSDGLVKHIYKDIGCLSISVNSGSVEDTVDLTIPINQVKLEELVQETSQSLFSSVVRNHISIIQLLLIPSDEGLIEPLSVPLPASSENKSVLALSRLAVEIRTRCCQLLALHMKDYEFAKAFLEQSCQSVDMLKYFSKEVLPSDKLCCTEFVCENLRCQFKDQTKPCALSLPLNLNSKQLPNHWNTIQAFPPLKSVIFTHYKTAVTYLGTPITSIGLPRGVLLQATKPLTLPNESQQVTLSILSLGQGADESGAPTISIGLSFQGLKKDGVWNHAEGALMLHSNGRIVHYKGSNLLSWHSSHIDHLLSPGDEVTLKWMPSDNSAGTVIFEVNHQQVGDEFVDMPSGLFPTVHIQQNGVRVKATFSDVKESLSLASQEDTVNYSKGNEKLSLTRVSGGHRRQCTQTNRQAVRMKPSDAYNSDHTGSFYKLSLNGYAKLSTGCIPSFKLDENWLEEDDEEEDSDYFEEERLDDINLLLVRSWEEKVFPAIRRRFRNESERRDGLDQIKGALSLGMIDIAKQTVEFLYEENGGLPIDLKLPDIDDVKKDLMSLSVEKLRPRMIVHICEQNLQPLFACKEQIKTFGLEGEVIRTDVPNELAEVETYLEEDGMVVRYWYPVDSLKKTSNDKQCAHSRKSSNSSSIAQLELFNCEFILSRLYCREAYLQLLKWACDDNCRLTSSTMLTSSPERQATLTSNVFLLQEWDLENLLYILDCKTMSCHGSLAEFGSPMNSPEQSIKQISPKLTEMVLHMNYNLVLDTFANIFERMQSTNPVLAGELVTEIIQGFRELDAYIPHENIHINDISLLSSSIYFPNSSCVLAAFKFGQKHALHPPEDLKVLIQPMEFSTKHKECQHTINNPTKFPSQIKGGKNRAVRAFPTVLFSSNVLKVCHGGAADSYCQLQLVGIPNTVLLALTFVDLMIYHHSIEVFKPSIYMDCLELLASFSLKFDITPWGKICFFYSISHLLQFMKDNALKIQTKSTEILLDKLLIEFETLEEIGTHSLGHHQIKPSYVQALAELCYQLHPIAQFMALDLPKALAKVTATMAALHTLKNQHELPKSVMQSIPVVEQPTFGSRYLVLTGIPKLLSSLEVASALKAALNCLCGLQVIEVYITSNLSQDVCSGSAVVQIQACSMQEDAKVVMSKIPAFHQTSSFDIHHETGTVIPLTVSKVRMDLQCEESTLSNIWIEFIKSKLIVSSGKLKAEVASTVKKIFESSVRDLSKESLKFSDLLLKKKSPFLSFLNGIKGRPLSDIRDDLREYFSLSKDNDDKLTIDSVWDLVEKLAKEETISLLRAFQVCGYDLDMKFMGSISNAEDSYTSWSIDEDIALVEFLNQWCDNFNQPFQDIQPNEFRWDYCNMKASSKSKLCEKQDADVRSRICLLKGMNYMVANDVAPLVNFDSSNGLSKELCGMKKIFFSSWKNQMLTSMINLTNERNDDQPGITVILDPLENIDRGGDNLSSTWFFQSYKVVSQVPSSSLCSSSPQCDDPQFPLVIKLAGEEVQGNSGSFRQFLAKIVDELQSTSVPILMPYMGNGSYKGMYMLRPGPLTILDEQLLMYFGQLLGIAVRSGIPLPLGLIPQFWKSLVDEPIDDQDLFCFDPNLYKYIQDLLSFSSSEAFDIFLDNQQHPSFMIQEVSGAKTELMKGGEKVMVTFTNRLQYIDLIKSFKKKELECKEKVNCIMAGMCTILPMGIIRSLFTWEEVQLRICGSDGINLNLLKKCTIYQVGISEEDHHIQNFWSVISSLNPFHLKLFLKFACNQERLPKPQDCNNLPPPYPMKIAPADAREEIQDNLLIRAETCIFMVKIPRYSNIDVMREKLLYSIQSAEDPLSG